ncbi:MAG: fibro-slime domain-containing protein, partial [Fibrobacterales bacterium]|nr:fibro-slime domain-containing protein [Fibrobacterales bacterium]
MKKSPFSALLTGAAFALLSATSAWADATSFAGNYVMVYGSSSPRATLWGNAASGITITQVAGQNWWKIDFSGFNGGEWSYPTVVWGNNNSVETDVKLSSFPSQGSTIYFFVDYSGKATISTEEPKSLYMYNPWAYSKPAISVNGSAPAGMMDMGEEHCGWYRAFFSSIPDQMMVSFSDANFGDVYGLNGAEDATPIDVKQTMVDAGEAWILPTPTPDGPPTVTGFWPDEDGSCTFSLAMIVRDFSNTRPDFEFGSAPGAAASAGCISTDPPAPTTGMVANTLNDKGKPVFSGVSKCKNENVTEWFTTVPVAGSPTGTNATCIDLPMSKTDDGMWRYNSIYDNEVSGKALDRVFLPVDHFNLYNETHYAALINEVGKADVDAGDYGKTPQGAGEAGYWVGSSGYLIHPDNDAPHNFHFCDETAADFDYRVGQKFLFAGDDDFWMFIDKRLVVDIGGLHARYGYLLNLDTLAQSQGWAPLSRHSMKIFHCDRQTEGSNFTMKTSIYFEQKKALYFDEVFNASEGSTSYEMHKIQGTNNTCAGIESEESGGNAIVTPNLKYVLVGGNLPAEGDTLGVGKHYGGIDIQDSAHFTITPGKMSSLSPGVYTFYAIDAYNPTLKVSVRIRVQGNLAVANPDPVTTLAGRGVPVIVGSVLYNKQTGQFEPDSGVTAYSLSVAGLDVYVDKDLKEKAATTMFETNEDGLDTVWVTYPRTSTENKTVTVNVFASTGQGKEITFVAPYLELTGVADWKYSYVPFRIVGSLVWDSLGTKVPCADCEGDLIALEGENLVIQDSAGNAVEELVVGKNGVTPFYVVNESDTGATGVVFAMKAHLDGEESHYAEATVGPKDLAKPPVPVVSLAAMFDDDGDGVPDHLRIVFSENIADSLPSSFGYWFPDTGNAVSVSRADMSKELVDGNRFDFTGDFVDTILTDGLGQVDWSYSFEGNQLKLSKSISDSCGPVLRSAEIDVDDAVRDVLKLRFSEKMNVDSRAEGSNWFRFRKKGEDAFYEYRTRNFSDQGRAYEIFFMRDTGDSLKAVAGDSVRIHYEPGLDSVMLVDAHGRHAHENSRLVRIMGKRRVKIGASVFAEADAQAIADSAAKANGGKPAMAGVLPVDGELSGPAVGKLTGTN